MSLTLCIPLAACALLLLPLCVVNFRRVYILYLFAFMPAYLFFRDLFIKFTGQDLPDILKALKDIAWVYVLLAAVQWFLLTNKKLFRSEIVTVWLVFVAYLLVCLVRGANLLGWFGSMYAIRGMFLYLPVVLLTVVLFSNKFDIIKVIRYFLYFLMAGGIYNLVQVVFRMPQNYIILRQEQKQHWASSSFFADYNQFGLFCVIGLALLLSLAGSRVFSKRFSLLAVLLMTVGVLTSNSRTGIVTSAAVIAVVVYTGAPRIKRLLLPAVVLGAACLLLMTIYGYHPFASHRIAGGFANDPRFRTIWPILWRIYERSPLFGYGWGVFGYTAYKIGHDILGMGGMQLVDSFYLLLLLNTGLVGAGLFCLFLFTLFRSSLRGLRHTGDPELRSLGIGLDAALLAYLVYMIGTNYLEGVPTNIYFWLLVGMKVVLDRIVRMQHGIECLSSNTRLAAAKGAWEMAV